MAEQLQVIKPLKGIENCKFRPIIKTLDDVKIQLGKVAIKPVNNRVAKMLKEIKPKKSLAINMNQGG